MKKSDIICGVVLFIFGLYICLKSLQYPLGTTSLPGAGLFPLIAAILLIILSSCIVISSFLQRDEQILSKVPFFPAKETPKRILYGFVSLVGFRYLVPILGFGPTTFIFIFFLGKVLARYGVKANLLFSACAAIASYYLFQILLKIPLPTGIFGI